jgi:hypothetical protein
MKDKQQQVPQIAAVNYCRFLDLWEGCLPRSPTFVQCWGWGDRAGNTNHFVFLTWLPKKPKLLTHTVDYTPFPKCYQARNMLDSEQAIPLNQTMLQQMGKWGEIEVVEARGY